MEEFLHEININEKLRPHLKNYPFTNHEITISLFIIANDGGWLHHPNIAIASSLIGILTYNTLEEGNRFQFKTKIEEDYEEAIRIVKGQKEQFSE